MDRAPAHEQEAKTAGPFGRADAPDATVDTPDLAGLMGRYCDGDEAAFRGLYAALAPRLLGYLTGLIGDRASAEDLLQHTFLKVHESRRVYVRGADPVPWIYTIAHRTFLDEARRRRRARVRLTVDGSPPPERPADAAPPPDEVAAARGGDALSSATLAALAKLPESQREALLLTKVQGRSHREAAAITGSTVGAIKLRAHRAYVALRALLDKQETA